MRMLLLLLGLVAPAAALDLTRATVAAASADRVPATMLLEEVEKRSQIRWSEAAASGAPVVRLQHAPKVRVVPRLPPRRTHPGGRSSAGQRAG